MLPQKLKLIGAPVIWRLYRATLRVSGFERGALRGPLIFACLHRDILPAIIHVRPTHPSLLVSQSPDGEILIRSLGTEGYGYVRGATREDGKRAFVALRRELDQGRSIGLAVDGPKGPYGVINEGLFQLSRLSGAVIVPLLAETERPFVLGTWDRTVVPRPFSRVVLRQGPILSLKRSANEKELATARRTLAEFFGVTGENHADH